MGYDTFTEDLVSEVSELRGLLAACQAREKVLYSAVNAVLTELEDNLAVNHWSANMTAALAALEQKTDDTALKAALAAERERCIKALELLWGEESCFIHDREIAAIRALGE